MRIDVATLFPRAFEYFSLSIVGEAVEKGRLALHCHDIRDFSLDKNKKVDDTPHGGGAGMLMVAPPLARTLEHIRTVGPEDAAPHIILLTPRGAPLTQSRLRELSVRPWLALVCGRYEGFDERIRDRRWVQEEISIGDYVLAGGELPAMVLIEGVARLLPGTLGNPESSATESFSEGLLEYPQYTRPEEFEGMSVPKILRSGDQKRIERWRRFRALRLTFLRRPDLLEKAGLTEAERRLVERWKRG